MKKIAFSALFAAVAALTAFAGADNEVNSVNTFGVMKISTTTMTNAFAVPFGGFSATGDAPNTLSNLLQKTAIPDGTKAYIWDFEDKEYDVYSYVESTASWTPQKVVVVDEEGYVSNGTADSEDEKAVATGTGFFLVFPSAPSAGTTRDVYLFGQALTNDYTVTVDPGTTALIAPASTNCGSTNSLMGIVGTQSVLSGSRITKAGDSIQMLDGGKTYYYIGGKWQYKSLLSWTEATEIDLEPGKAFWYTNRGTVPITITLTPAP